MTKREKTGVETAGEAEHYLDLWERHLELLAKRGPEPALKDD